MKRNNIVGGIFFLTVGLIFAVYSRSVDIGDWSEPGAGFLPFYGGLCMIGMAALLLVNSLVGDWVFIGAIDGTYTGWGEATHSGDDKRCVAIARELFHDDIAQRQLSRESIREFETKMGAGRLNLVTATACSALNYALYELLAKQAGE